MPVQEREPVVYENESNKLIAKQLREIKRVVKVWNGRLLILITMLIVIAAMIAIK